jgi:hypothetical protein
MFAPRIGEGLEDGAFQGGQIVGREVGEVAILGVAPDRLDGIEIGRVGRQPFDDDPRVLGEPGGGTRRPVRAVPVPDKGEAVRQMTTQWKWRTSALRTLWRYSASRGRTGGGAGPPSTVAQFSCRHLSNRQ